MSKSMLFHAFDEARARAAKTASNTGYWTAILDRSREFGTTTYEVQPFATPVNESEFTRLGIVAFEVAPR